MKWLFVIGMGIIVISIAAVGFLVWDKDDDHMYSMALDHAIANATSDNSAVAINNETGVQTRLTEYNMIKIKNIIDVTSRDKLRLTPKNIDKTTSLEINFDGETYLRVYNDKSDSETAYVHLEKGNDSWWYRISGLRTHYWVSFTISADGYHGPNEVIEADAA